MLELMLAMVVLALLSFIAVPAYESYAERSRVGQAVADLMQMELVLERFQANNFQLPDNLADVGMGGATDPWGNVYQYLRLEGNGDPGVNGQRRRDRNLNPVNSDYDLVRLGITGRVYPDCRGNRSDP